MTRSADHKLSELLPNTMAGISNVFLTDHPYNAKNRKEGIPELLLETAIKIITYGSYRESVDVVKQLADVYKKEGSKKGNGGICPTSLRLANFSHLLANLARADNAKEAALEGNIAFNELAARTCPKGRTLLSAQVVASCLNAGQLAVDFMLEYPNLQASEGQATKIFGLLADNPYRLSIPEPVRAYARQMKEGLQRGDVKSVYNPRFKV